jgi:type I restriction enzyme S subunit
MSYAPYPAYKDSGSPWIGDIPANWDTQPFFALATPNKKKNTAGTETNLLSLSYGCIIRKDIKDNSGLLPESFDTYQVVDKGQIIFRLTDLQNDKVSLRSAIVPERGIITSAYLAVRFKGLDPRFADFLMRSYDKSMVFYELGGGVRQSGKFEDLKWMPIIVPPIEEQTAIVRFLNEKTAEIDDLIAKKDELLRLLAEQRTALITHAVTKGLDPAATMKPSGIDWLGDVPEGWDIKPLKYLGRFQNGISIGGESFGSGFPFVSYSDVYNNLSLPETGSGLVESSEKDRILYSVERGDIFFTRTSETIEEIAISSVCETTIPGAVFAGFLIRCRPYPKRLSVGFSKYYFRNSRLRDYFVKEMNLVTRASLGQTLLGNLLVALPPLDQQESISDYLDERLATLSRVEADGRASIRLLKEYRTSIITNAVTGKIKVA